MASSSGGRETPRVAVCLPLAPSLSLCLVLLLLGVCLPICLGDAGPPTSRAGQVVVASSISSGSSSSSRKVPKGKALRCSRWAWKTCIDLGDGVSVLTLTREQGSGMDAPQHYLSGIFSVDMKLSKGYSGGTIFAFYLMDSVTRSNREYDHAEIDFEFYGNKTSKDIMLATNVFSNHKQNLMQFKLPWDPAEAWHNYAIQYNTRQIVWYVDGRPIRILNRTEGKPWPRYSMQPQATVWEAEWIGTKVNYSHGPMSAMYATYRAAGCEVDTNTAHLEPENGDFEKLVCEGIWNRELTPHELAYHDKFQKEHKIAAWGWDTVWNPIPCNPKQKCDYSKD